MLCMYNCYHSTFYINIVINYYLKDRVKSGLRMRQLRGAQQNMQGIIRGRRQEARVKRK